LQGRYFEDLSVGESARTTQVVDAAAIEAFAAVSGDVNPVHLDEAYAKTTPFGGRIAHGMLAAAYISAVIGNRLPGPGAIYLNQTLRFRRPVRIGDAVTTLVTVKALDATKAQATLETVCSVNGKAVVEGEALIMVPRLVVSSQGA
jgi:3-hydroxybutyryl-CoA dehydratase